MNKMNKKGFTLIEMLVVIAIIAVLVSIIIPVVGNSTAKAQAATDAANLRSAKATLTIAVLNGTLDKNVDNGDATSYPKHISGKDDATEPAAPECKSNDDWTFGYTTDDQGNVTVFFQEGSGDTATQHKIAEFAGLAGDNASETDEGE